MKKQYISDLAPGSPCDSLFVAKNKKLFDFRNKPGQFLSVVLRDRDGEVDAKAWDNGPALGKKFEDGDVIHAQGRVESFNKSMQVVLITLRRCKPEEYEIEDFLPRTPKDIDQLIATIHAAIDAMSNQHLRQLLNAFYRDEAFLEEFKRAPAAKTLHHAYIGGLAEHFCAVLIMAKALCENYPQIDADLLMTGVLLHDLGKLRELRQSTMVDYTDAGRLLGHIYIGAEMAEQKMAAIEGFPDDLRMRVVHMILSHHGTREFGAVALPATPEAVALHLVENADAQMHQVFRLTSAVKDPAQVWTEYDRLHQRHYFTGRGKLTLE